MVGPGRPERHVRGQKRRAGSLTVFFECVRNVNTHTSHKGTLNMILEFSQKFLRRRIFSDAILHFQQQHLRINGPLSNNENFCAYQSCLFFLLLGKGLCVLCLNFL